MKNRIFRIISLIATLIGFVVSLFLLFTLDFESHHLINEDGEQIISLINGRTAIFGGNSIILRGSYVDNELVLDTSIFIPATFAFDYLTVIGLIVNLISLIFMIFYFNRQVLLIISSTVNILSLIFLVFQPQFFLIVNGGRDFLNLVYSPENNNSIISIGMIVFIIFNGIIDIFYLIRSIALFTNKVTIE